MIWAIFRMVPLVLGAVQAVEQLKSAKKGQAKQDAAVNMVRAALPLAEEIGGADLLDDAAVDAATRHVINAVVALENVVRDAQARRTQQGLGALRVPTVPADAAR